MLTNAPNRTQSIVFMKYLLSGRSRFIQFTLNLISFDCINCLLRLQPHRLISTAIERKILIERSVYAILDYTLNMQNVCTHIQRIIIIMINMPCFPYQYECNYIPIHFAYTQKWLTLVERKWYKNLENGFIFKILSFIKILIHM